MLALTGLMASGAAGTARAQQGSAPDLLQAARKQYDEAVYDSALALVEAALGASPSPQERAWAFSLRALVRLAREDVLSARQDFLRGYETDARLMSDSFRLLTDLHSEAGRVLGEAHQTYVAATTGANPVVNPAAEPPQPPPQPVVPLTVLPAIPSDTSIDPRDGRLMVGATPSRPARVIFHATPAEVPTQVLWADTLLTGSTRAFGWDLRGRDGVLVAPGRYALHVSAVDSAGGESAPTQRFLTVERVPADTQGLPLPLALSAFEPETRQVKRASPSVLLVGAGLAAAAALLPEALARAELTEGRDRDGTQLAIAGSVTLAGLVGFLAGHHAQAVPEAARRNAELRQRDAANRQEIARANDQARANAPVRVRLEASGP